MAGKTMSMTVGISPHCKAMPPVSAGVKTFFSKASMAQAMVAPAEIVSIPNWLHRRPALQVAARSIEPSREPKAAMVSYSGPGPRETAKGPSSTCTTRLQAMRQ